MDQSKCVTGNKLVKTVNNWQGAREVFSAFIGAHPELGLRDSPIAFRNFCYRHGAALMALDVMRKTSGLRSPAIFDTDRFDEVAFELITSSASQNTKMTFQTVNA